MEDWREWTLDHKHREKKWLILILRNFSKIMSIHPTFLLTVREFIYPDANSATHTDFNSIFSHLTLSTWGFSLSLGFERGP